MKTEQIMAYCGAMPGVTIDFPFGPEPACYRVGGRIFAQVFPVGVKGALCILLEDEGIPREQMEPMLTLHCEPFRGDFYRQQYPGAVLRPYHSPPAQQPHANTVRLNGTVPDDVLREMLDHAYEVVFGKLPKAVREQIMKTL